jgi:hypothetical protein
LLNNNNCRRRGGDSEALAMPSSWRSCLSFTFPCGIRTNATTKRSLGTL